MEKEFINPESLIDYRKSFTQVVTVKHAGTKTIYVSGQVGIDKKGNIVGGGNLSVHASQAFKNLTEALEAAGAEPKDVVKTNVYIPDFNPEKTRPIFRAMRQHFTQEDLPASTWVGVKTLLDPGYLVEVEAIAVVEE